MEYRELTKSEINHEIFDNFTRHQDVSKCWRKIDGDWIIVDVSFVDNWDKDAYSFLVACLQNTCEMGGIVYGAFHNEELKGFFSIEPKLFGQNKEYLDLSSIHVSEDMRGKGVGKILFQLAVKWAKSNGAKKLYISAHSSVKSQAFYKSMGCVEALEYSQTHVDKEPYDCQMEFSLS